MSLINRFGSLHQISRFPENVLFLTGRSWFSNEVFLSALLQPLGDERMHLEHIFKLHSARNLSFSVSLNTKIPTELHLEMGFKKNNNNHKNCTVNISLRRSSRSQSYVPVHLHPIEANSPCIKCHSNSTFARHLDTALFKLLRGIRVEKLC